MKNEKKYYRDLDIIRVISCIGVLLYHLGFLKGGFLAVCCFFVLSGYLSYTSLSRKDNISLKEYYKSRLKHIYLPLICVVFLTTCFISFVPEIHWFQLKPETTSVLFGYNNYWQLSVNADYFARHISSPFMHFWYIGILLQFELVFPFLFVFIKKSKEKIGKVFPMIILILLILGSCGYFIYQSFNHNIMNSYYDTLCRCFSLLLGVLIGYIHKEYKSLYLEKGSKIIFWIYTLIFILLQFIIDSNSSIYSIMMILVSLISCRMITYGTISTPLNLNFWERENKYLASVSYEVYLFQYPVIFIFQYLMIPDAWKLPIMILFIFGLSYFLHFSLNFKDEKNKYIRIVCGILVAIFASFGLVQYVNAKDYTNEMNDLKNQLSENQKLIEEKQKDYEERLKKENEEWNNVLSDLENGEENLKDYVAGLPITAVGDSVMLGAVPSLYQQFPNGYFNAAVSRTDYEANGILLSVKNQGMLADNIVIHLGTNGQCGLPCQRDIMATCEGRNVYFVTVTNDYDVHVNSGFYELQKMYPNITIIDWGGAAAGHPEYFVADGIHLTPTGMSAYTNTIYNGIYNLYHKQYEEKKNKAIQEHEAKINSKISFYGNDTLVGISDNLLKEYPDSGIKVSTDIYQDIKNDINNQTISKRIVVLMDSTNGSSIEEYQKIINLTKDYQVTFVFIYHNAYTFKEDNIKTISLKKDDKTFMVDGVHLSDTGNKELIKQIKKGLS